jgi:hypothetical protein
LQFWFGKGRCLGAEEIKISDIARNNNTIHTHATIISLALDPLSDFIQDVIPITEAISISSVVTKKSADIKNTERTETISATTSVIVAIVANLLLSIMNILSQPNNIKFAFQLQ